MKTIEIYLCFMLLIIGLSVASRADIVYNVTFEDPPHLVDQQVAVGSGSDVPQFADSTVIVRDGPADFTTQTASLEPAGSMTFFPGTTYAQDMALISWDMAMTDLGSGGPAAVSLGSDSGLSLIMMFMADSSIEVSLGGVDPINVGSFTLGEQDSFAFAVDLDNDIYGLSLNGSPVISDEPLSLGWDLVNVSFGRDNLADPTYAVDNFRWEVVPEPSTIFLMSVGGLLLAGFRRRR